MAAARRVYLYGIAFASLGMLVAGLAGLLELLLEALAEAVLGPIPHVGSGNLTNRVSFSSALAGIGLVAWLIHWSLANRAVRRGDTPELRSTLRALYLYAALLVGGLLLTFNARSLIADLLEAGFGVLHASDLIGGSIVPPLARLVVVAALWSYHARVVAADRAAVREAGGRATLRRWCTYVLAFVGLMLLVFGAAGLLALLWDVLLPGGVTIATGGRWLAVGVASQVSSVLAGLGCWLLAWTWSVRRFWLDDGPDPERASTLHKVYLYLVVAVAVSWTVWNLGQVLYLLLRSTLIPEQAGGVWSVARGALGSTIAHLLVFGLTWAYHRRVLRREAAAAPEVATQAGIRRVYGYLVALVGVATFGVGLAGTISTLLDLLVQSSVVRPEHWWEERLSLFGTLLIVGLPVWLLPWTSLQREADEPAARQSLARRIYLFIVLGVTVLTLLGSGAFTLYQLLRFALGERWTGAQTGDLLDAGSAAIAAGILLAYHVGVFRRDAGLTGATAAPTSLEAPERLLADGSRAVARLPTDVTTPERELPAHDGVAVPVRARQGPASVALLIAQTADPAALAELQRQIERIAPLGTTVRHVEVDADLADRLLDESAGI
ncbi:MAG: hypothetical protein IT305_16535 [Chloroflexi bacterium]|nr:hypothetical protein [Chloroflexota bacterium]